MEKNPKLDFHLPPGFRFHPSDEELIVHYLRKKATKTPLPASIIAEVELYKLNPWDLPKKSLFGDEEWYFFTPRDRKYPNGMRPNRMAASGYWKATGIDKPIVTSCESKVIGVKKALVFYTGRPPRGNKTDWIMHEYRLPEPDASWSNKKEKSMRLDEWVLCRVRKKTGMPFGNFPENQNGSSINIVQQQPKLDKQCSTEAAPNFDMVRDYLYKDCPLLPFLFNSQDFPSTDTAVSCISFEGNNKASSSVCEDNFNIDYLQSSATPSYVRKRKLIGQGNGKEPDSFGHPNKKAINRDYQKEEQQLPPLSLENDISDHSAMISSSRNQLDKNNYLDHLCPSMMYQELYSFAFT